MREDLRNFLYGVADAGAFLGVMFTVAGLFGRYHCFLELFTQIKLTLVLCFAGYVAAELLLKRRKTALLAMIPLLINAAPPMMLLLPQKHQNTPENPAAIRILQSNVLTSNYRADKLLNLIKRVNPDVIVLQETNERWLHKLKVLTKEYPVFADHPREDNFGAAIFCKSTNAVASIEFLNDPAMLPLSKVVISCRSKSLTVFGAHPLAPITSYLWKQRNLYTREMADKLAETDGAIILTGDLNNTPWSYYYKQLIKKSGLLDASQGRGPLPTWPAENTVIHLPLDHCLHSDDVIIKKFRRGPNIGSDHYPLIIEALF